MGHSRCPNSHGDRMLDSSIESTRRVSMQYAARQRPGLIHHRGYHKLSHRRRTTTTTTTTTKREKKNSGIRSKSFRCFLLLLLLLPSWITETRMGRGGTRRRVKEKKKEKKKKRKKKTGTNPTSAIGGCGTCRREPAEAAARPKDSRLRQRSPKICSDRKQVGKWERPFLCCRTETRRQQKDTQTTIGNNETRNEEATKIEPA